LRPTQVVKDAVPEKCQAIMRDCALTVTVVSMVHEPWQLMPTLTLTLGLDTKGEGRAFLKLDYLNGSFVTMTMTMTMTHTHTHKQTYTYTDMIASSTRMPKAEKRKFLAMIFYHWSKRKEKICTTCEL
jgi:hypothetical protein